MQHIDNQSNDLRIGDRVTSVTLAVTLGVLLAALPVAVYTGWSESDAVRGAIAGGVVMMIALAIGAVGLIASIALSRRRRDLVADEGAR